MKLGKSAFVGLVGSEAESDTPAPEPSRLMARLDRLCLHLVAQRLAGARLQLRLWDGSTVSSSDLPPVGSLTVKDRPTLWRLLVQEELGFGESYTDGGLDVSGDLTGMIESFNRATNRNWSPDSALRPPRRRAASDSEARRNVHQHYDLGNAFYRLWLDDAMVYTCAYFERPECGLEEAQQAKLDYICRKIELRPGDRVIEAGCGWGALAIHMARHYGATVEAYNVSAEQLAFARDAAARAGVADRVTFIDADFRSIRGTCDAFVSIGMLEHVGEAEYRALGGVINRVVETSRGRGLLHFIGRNHVRDFDPWIQRYIFPGAYAPVLSEVTREVFEPWNLSVLDVENLRRHYAKTLRHWRLRFERLSGRVAEMFDERFVRMWRLYLASAEASFSTGDLQLYQITFSRADDNDTRWTRADLYATPEEPSHGQAAHELL
jgi:cyclopropane-fatty-acyl-phospholipid synthase